MKVEVLSNKEESGNEHPDPVRLLAAQKLLCGLTNQNWKLFMKHGRCVPRTKGGREGPLTVRALPAQVSHLTPSVQKVTVKLEAASALEQCAAHCMYYHSVASY